MPKFLIVLCALVACAAAKPSVAAPLTYNAPISAAYSTPYTAAYSTPYAAAYAAPYATAYSVYRSPLAYTAPAAVAAPLTHATPAAVAAPLAYANAHLDAAYASSRVDVQQNYNAAVIPAAYAAAPVITSLSHTAPAAVAAPLTYATPAAVAAPLAYANAHLDAAYASSRVDVQQNYNAAVIPAAYAAAPVITSLSHTAPAAVAAPLTHATPAAVAAPLAYANAYLDAASASSRIDIKQNYNAAVVPAVNSAAPVAASLSHTAPAAVAAPLTHATPAAVAAPLAYANAYLDAASASSRIDIKQNYNAAVVPVVNTAAPVAASLVHTAPAAVAAPLTYTTPAAVAAPLAYANAYLDAAFASSRIDIKQNYNAAVIPAAYAAAPVVASLSHTVPPAVAAPLTYATPAAIAAPLAYSIAPLDAAYASSRVDVQQNYNAAAVPPIYAATPLPAAVAPVDPIKYTAAPALW